MAGNPGWKDLDDQQELYYPTIYRAIAETGYDGYVGQEFTPKGDPLEGMEQANKVYGVYLVQQGHRMQVRMKPDLERGVGSPATR